MALNITVEDFRIDISHEQSFKYLQAKQFDSNSRKRRLIITDNNIPLSFTGKELVTLSLSINGDNYSNTTCLFGEDGYPYVTFTDSMLSKDGDISCEIRIYDSEGSMVITTFTFMMTVSQSLLNQDRIVESSEFNILNDLILQANTIPDLIKEFDKSQEQINALIEQIQNDIKTYQEDFSDMKTQYTSDFNTLIEQINTDISNYQIEYNTLKGDITNLKDEVTQWYTTAQEAENIRISNEEQRQKNTADAISNAETATQNANTATSNANNAAEEAEKQANYAHTQAEAARAAIEALHYELIDCDGGYANTNVEDYENDFNGGGAGV